MENLVIVESPSKSKTIEKYLGSDYKVVASMGHIRDLATSGKFGLGVDVDNDFKPNYEAMPSKKKTIADLKKLSKEASNVYLATDPDREGEAISWHLKEALGLKRGYQRVTFNEITKDVIVNAFKEPRDIDMNLVKSQETRRILDRIIGFRLSRLMQSKTGGKSAGRVQSVALKLIVDRENEISKFIPLEYWSIVAKFDGFEAELFQYNNKKLELHNEEETLKVLNSLGNDYVVSNVESKEKVKKGVMPFKTSTLQQVAVNKLNFASSKTMSIAQKLYEGIDIGNEMTGLITYMRTDSERVSPVFANDAFKYIKETYGDKYVGHIKKQKSNDNMQDAHEGIRVTNPYRTPSSIKKYLTPDEYKLYSLIYARSIACLMSDAKVLATTVILDNNDYEFKATGSILTFDGYLKVYSEYESSEDTILPKIDENSVLQANEVVHEQHFTKPPARYTESTLIKELERLGIGRPSTYATIMETIKARGYVTIEDKKFIPTDIGTSTTIKLQEGFSDIVNVKYTANMESDLDEIALGDKDNILVLHDFYDKFEPLVESAFKNMEKVAALETGEDCPMCGNPLVVRNGKYGKFTACSNYPTCKYIKKEKAEIKEICTCPSCGGMIVEKKSHKGKIFYACNNYPKCQTAYWDMPTGEKSSTCGDMILVKGDKKYCNTCKK